jgi:hypothetical protein
MNTETESWLDQVKNILINNYTLTNISIGDKYVHLTQSITERNKKFLDSARFKKVKAIAK